MPITIEVLHGDETGEELLVEALRVLDPEVLILDEPTNGLDPEGMVEMRQIIQKIAAQRKTILLASHNMAEVERLCDNVLMMKRGRIVDRGAPGELLARYRRDDLEQVFLDIARSGAEAGA